MSATGLFTFSNFLDFFDYFSLSKKHVNYGGNIEYGFGYVRMVENNACGQP
jgi:hypothetical protein